MKQLVLLLLSLTIVACASPKPTPVQSTAQDSNNDKTTAASVTASSATTSTTATNPLTAINAEAVAKLVDKIQKINPEADTATTANLAAEIHKLHNESVYFDYDEYAIKPEFRNTLEQHASDIKKQNNNVVLEGNADERGSAAYNMALGEKRATSVKRILVTLGIPSSQIKVVSYGNTRPKLDCHEEKCWQENRRVDFVFQQ